MVRLSHQSVIPLLIKVCCLGLVLWSLTSLFFSYRTQQVQFILQSVPTPVDNFVSGLGLRAPETKAYADRILKQFEGRGMVRAKVIPLRDRSSSMVLVELSSPSRVELADVSKGFCTLARSVEKDILTDYFERSRNSIARLNGTYSETVSLLRSATSRLYAIRNSKTLDGTLSQALQEIGSLAEQIQPPSIPESVLVLLGQNVVPPTFLTCTLNNQRRWSRQMMMATTAFMVVLIASAIVYLSFPLVTPLRRP